MKKTISLLLLLSISLALSISANEASSTPPTDATVYFIAPLDGETVTQTFRIKFGLSGMGIAPAGTMRDKTGHHHLLINLETLPDMTKPLAATDKIVHFGGGQTETELTLSPGTHTLQLLLGDYAHRPHSKPVLSKQITITVE